LTAVINFIGPATFWGLSAALPAVLAEYLYRTIHGPWWHYLWAWLPMQLFIGYSVYRLVTVPHTSLLDAFVVFAFSTTALRVFITVVILGDPVRIGTWVALGLLIAARFSQMYLGR
jgi:hypothetical protein